MAGVIAGVVLLPSLAGVSKASNAQFLSPAAPSVRAGELAAPFQRHGPSSEAVLTQAIIVDYWAEGKLTPADNTAISRAERGSPAGPAGRAQALRSSGSLRSVGPTAGAAPHRARIVS
jgi:hypothetical protein